MKTEEPRRTRSRFGLAPKLIILVVLVALIVGAMVGALVLIKSRDALRGHIFINNLQTADLAARYAAHYVDLAKAAARELATRPLIIRAAANGSFAQARPELVRFMQLNPRFDSGVTIFDTRGIARVSGVATPLNIGKSSADRDWFQQVKATGKPYLGTPAISQTTGRPAVPYGVPILDERGKLCGVLVAGISISVLSDVIVKTQVGLEASAALVDFRRGGIILAHADPKRILNPVSGLNEATRRLLAGERGTLETINSMGERVLNAFSPVWQAPWGILITQPHKSAFAALDALTKQVLLLGVLAILITALMGGWVALRLSRPILALRNAANALAAGDLTRRVKFSRRDEIGELAQVFDRMADALQAEQTTLRRRAENFFNLTLDLLCVAGFDGYFKTLNPTWEQTLGFTAAELLGRPIIAFVHPEDRRATMEATAQLTAGQDIVSFESRYLCKDGSYRWLMWNSVSAAEEQLIYAVAHDVTERKSNQEKLQRYAKELARSNADLEQFTYVASHDLQEPLRMVTSYLQLIERRYKERLDADGQTFMKYAVDGAARMQELIHDLLTYSRVGTRGQPFEPTNVETPLEQAISNLKTLMAEAKAAISHDAMPVVMADSSQLMQLFQNLIANAVKFRSAGPPNIHIGAEPTQEGWQFSVQDNGIGIDMKYRDRIFIMFQRLQTREDYQGTGIGLAIAKKVVERHGGRIWFESKPDEGTTVYFTLPALGGKSA